MPLIQVTLGEGATPIIAALDTPPANTNPTQNFVTIQNNDTHLCACGDSTVTLATGILLNPGTPSIAQGGSTTMFGKIYLQDTYIIGTPGDVVNVFCN